MKGNDRILSIFGNIVPKALCLLLACFIVISLRFLNIEDRVVKISLDVMLPDNLVAASLVPSTVDIVITGDDSVIYLVDPSDIKAYADFSSVKKPGIGKVPVEIIYNENIFTDDALTIAPRPSSVRILFEEADAR